MSSPPTAWQAQSASFPQVEVADVGAISLATLDELRDALGTEVATFDQLTSQAEELDGQAEDRLADVGALLVPRRASWLVPAGLFPRMAETNCVVGLIALVDRWTPPPRLGQAFQQLRAALAARLRHDLVAIARAGAGPGGGVKDVAALLFQAGELRTRAQGLHDAATSVRSRIDPLEREVRLREDAADHLGFDALALAADVLAHGMPTADCPYELPPGEVAHLVAGATQAAPLLEPGAGSGAGGSVGRAINAHTGLRHWIGSFRNRALPVSSSEPGDAGTLIVSNHRLLFAGSRETIVTPLDGILDMDVYRDGIAVHVLGRQAPHALLLDAPRLVAFTINWAISSHVYVYPG